MGMDWFWIGLSTVFLINSLLVTWWLHHERTFGLTLKPGMAALGGNGLRYPFPQYGIQQDVRDGMAASYPERARK